MSEAEEMPSISDLREEGVDEITQPYRKQINETPELLSLLYDVDLLPEQIVYRVNAVRMAAFCLVYQKIAEARQEGIEQAAKVEAFGLGEFVPTPEGITDVRAFGAGLREGQLAKTNAILKLLKDRKGNNDE